LPDHWLVDGLSLDQVLVNLLLQVHDTGAGMLPDQLARLFQPFEQGDASRTRRVGGTGLGLSICKRLVELMGGEIGVRSEVEHGSTFWFELPMANAAAEALDGTDATSLVDTQTNSAPDVPRGPRLLGAQVLVVDDSDINQEVAVRLLRSEGAVVQTASHGLEALNQLQSEPTQFDIVLMDVQMPIMNGFETAQVIKTREKSRSLPIVALTAGAMLSERQRAIEVGMNDFASKPLDPHALVGVIRHHVQHARGEVVPITPAHPTPTQAPTCWPALDGIDMQAVAADFGQDVGFYRRLLKRLLSEYGPAHGSWRAPPESGGGSAPLRARLHKLSGTAAVLCAHELAALAKRAEQHIEHDPQADLTADAQAIDACLIRLEHAARDWLGSPDANEPGQRPDTPSVLDPASLEAWRHELATQNLDALARFQTLGPALRTQLAAETFTELERALESLDFAQALSLLKEQGIGASALSDPA